MNGILGRGASLGQGVLVEIVTRWQHFGWAGMLSALLRQGENLIPDRLDAIREFGIAIHGRREWFMTGECGWCSGLWLGDRGEKSRR